MATKLFPPSIDGKLPAQVGDQLKIPFIHSKAVETSDYTGLMLKITSPFSGNQIAILEGEHPLSNIATFTLPEGHPLIIGQYYKVQLAYGTGASGALEPGYYSTVGIFKYTEIPTINLEISTFGTKITGQYMPPAADKTEKVASYRFDIYDGTRLFDTSGEILNNASGNTHEFIVNKMYELDKQYQIAYTITTINSLTVRKELKFTISKFELESDDWASIGNLQVLVNSENGYNNIIFTTEMTDGNFRLVRNNMGMDKEVLYIATGSFVYNDYAIEQGGIYEYNIYYEYCNPDSEQTVMGYLKPVTVFSDFEDMFLSDGERQLAIRFNPKVSNFKEVVTESKLNTISSQFPVFFRNGSTKYKELSIAGLISYYMDNDELFLTTPIEWKTTNLTGENIAAERQFKLEVLTWLNNGQPKLLRTPAEGNYIVRLTNISLSPDDKLGRMLHSFTATASEIAEYNRKNLVHHKLLLGQTSEVMAAIYLTDIDNLFVRDENSAFLIIIEE